MISIYDSEGTGRVIPCKREEYLVPPLIRRLIEAYYAPTVVDVALVLLEGGAEVGQEWLE